MNLGLIDEIRLTVSPLILGRGKTLFKDVKNRHLLKFVSASPAGPAKVSLIYTTTLWMKIFNPCLERNLSKKSKNFGQESANIQTALNMNFVGFIPPCGV